MPVGQSLNNGLQDGLHGAAHLGQGVFNKGKGFCQDFKDFLNKGNAFDLAVAFVIATAFSAVVRSLVEDIITPIFGLANNRNLDEMFLVIRCGKTSCSFPTRALAQADGAVTWNWGRFINTVLYLILVGLFLFILVKIYYTLKRETFIKDKTCLYCGKDMTGTAARCPFCTSWLDQDVRRKVDGDLSHPDGDRSMSTTTFGTSTGLLREKDAIEDRAGGGMYQQGMNPNPLNPYTNQTLTGAQMGTAAGMASNLGPQTLGGAGAGGIGMNGGSGGGTIGASSLEY